MAKKYNKIPRKKKKQIKKQANVTTKVSRSELLELEKKNRARQQRQIAQNKRYKQNKTFLKTLGIPTDIITKSTSIKETERRAKAYLAEQEKSARKIKQANLYARKVNKLIDAGFTRAEAEKLVGSFWRPKNNTEIDRIIYEKKNPINPNIRAKGNNYLYIGFAEKVGGFSKYNLSQYSDDELLEMINDRIRDARINPDDSHGNKFKGVFQFGSFDSKEKAQRRANYWYKHGYDLNYQHGNLKLDNSRYDKVTISNSFSYREFLEMTYTCADQMLNWQVEQFIDTLKEFDHDNGFNFTRNFI